MITVIIPVLNAQKTLSKAIKSIQHQTLRDIKIIVIDNGSTDCSLTIARRAASDDRRITVLEYPEPGLASALNFGINFAHTKYIARMDSDDISHPKRLEMQLIFMENNPDIDLSGTPAIGFNYQSKAYSYLAVPNSHEQCIDFIYAGLSPFVHPTIIGKTLLMQKYPYSPAHLNAQDYGLFANLLKNGCKFSNLGNPYLIYNTTYVRHQKYIHTTSLVYQEVVKDVCPSKAALFSDSLLVIHSYYENQALSNASKAILLKAFHAICSVKNVSLSLLLFRIANILISSRSNPAFLLSPKLLLFLIKSRSHFLSYIYFRIKSTLLSYNSKMILTEFALFNDADPA